MLLLPKMVYYIYYLLAIWLYDFNDEHQYLKYCDALKKKKINILWRNDAKQIIVVSKSSDDIIKRIEKIEQ